MDKIDIDKPEESNTIVYTISWIARKNARLKRIRKVSFEEILTGDFIEIRRNPSREGQQLLIFDYKGYIWAVPFIFEKQGIFLKTLYPCRKYKKLFKKR